MCVCVCVCVCVCAADHHNEESGDEDGPLSCSGWMARLPEQAPRCATTFRAIVWFNAHRDVFGSCHGLMLRGPDGRPLQRERAPRSVTAV